MGIFGSKKKEDLKTHVRNGVYLVAGVIRYVLGSPRRLARHVIGNYSQKKVSAELRKFINLYLASSLLQRLLILSIITIFYVITRELGLNSELYVAIITVLVGLYTAIIVIVGTCLYLSFCLEHRISFNPWQAAYYYTASEINNAINGNSRTTRLLLRIAVGDTEDFAHEVAHNAMFSQEIRKIIYLRLLYYAFIATIYLLGYNLLYHKLIAIDFHNFIHPFTWAWHYLVNVASA